MSTERVRKILHRDIDHRIDEIRAHMRAAFREVMSALDQTSAPGVAWRDVAGTLERARNDIEKALAASRERGR